MSAKTAPDGSEARISEHAGALQLAGVLDYRSAPALRGQGKKLIEAAPTGVVRLDCAGVTHSSSVGLALLLAFMRDAKACHKVLAIAHLPQEMRQIAEVSGISALLAVATAR